MWGFSTIADSAKSIGAVFACCGTLGTAYVGAGGPVPASSSWVQAEVKRLEGSAKDLQNDVVDGRLQTNSIERRLLRKEKIDRNLELGRETETRTRSILQNRLDQIEEDLEENGRERQRLENQKKSIETRP